MRVTYTVTNAGVKTVHGVNVRVTSPVLAAWKPTGGTGLPLVEDGAVYWLDQQLYPGQKQRYIIRARFCAGGPSGPQPVVGAAVYRLTNATGSIVGGSVVCLTGTAPLLVSRSGGQSCRCVHVNRTTGGHIFSLSSHTYNNLLRLPFRLHHGAPTLPRRLSALFRRRRHPRPRQPPRCLMCFIPRVSALRTPRELPLSGSNNSSGSVVCRWTKQMHATRPALSLDTPRPSTSASRRPRGHATGEYKGGEACADGRTVVTNNPPRH